MKENEVVHVFKNEEFGRVRTVIIDSEPWFVGKDVASALDYKDTSDALKKHVDEEDKLSRRFTDSGQARSMYVINESGLYALIMNSKLPSAKKFKRWVTSEVLPSIRKTGEYKTNNSTQQQQKEYKYQIEKSGKKIFPHQIIKKSTFEGKPVMTTKDVSQLLGISNKFVYKYNKDFDIYARKLNKREVQEFALENNIELSHKIDSMFVFTLKEIVKLVDVLDRKDLTSCLREYFQLNAEQIIVQSNYIERHELDYLQNVSFLNNVRKLENEEFGKLRLIK